MKAKYQSVAVVGIGDQLTGNDGFGPLVIRYLQNDLLPPGMELFIDLAEGEGLLSRLRQFSWVILIDLVQTSMGEGTILKIPLEELDGRKEPLSLHQFSLLYFYQNPLIRKRLKLPGGLLFGVDGGELLPFSTEVTSAIKKIIPTIGKKIKKEWEIILTK